MVGGGGERPKPPPPPSPSPLLADISNFKTPKPSFANPTAVPHSPLPLFFTASKNTSSSTAATPTSTFRRRHHSAVVPPSASRCVKAARRLKAFEVEQSRSSRKAQIRRERALKSFARSMTAWLNFLLENPRLCGCEVSVWSGGGGLEGLSVGLSPKGKREGSRQGGGRVGVDRAWRSPKRQRGVDHVAVRSASFLLLRESLRDVCSFEDLKQRMGGYLDERNCEEVFSMMSQVAKNIDEGRLKMKGCCPIVTDLALKKKATRVLMCYTRKWLRIGLYVVFGGESLLLKEDRTSEQDDLLLKMIIERQFFSHIGLAKSYSYNKLVEGLYRPGYYEALGNIILKRFLLFVLILDSAKSQSALPLKYGIDGIDGGSPPLFCCQSNIKSSRQVICEFLSEVMHGEGDLLSHLAIVGYKVTHQQLPLAEYNFSITSLFEDLQDGLRLCRAIQLLLSDASIVSKLMAPSDNSKKSLHNCGVAMQYLKKAGVPLLDKDGVIIVAEDILNGDKELTLSILWNMFVYLQIPLLINKTLLVDEIASIKGCDMDSKYDANNYLGTLLVWIQAIGEKFGVMVDDFSSMVDGKALKCLVDYYFGDELHGCNIFEHEDENKHECAITSLTAIENTAATAPIRNFVLAQKVAKVLGSYPEILQIGDILELDETFDERSVIILLVFLVAQLVGRKDLDQINIYKLMGFKSRTPSLRCSSTSHSPHRSGISLLNIQSWTETITQNLDHLEVQKILENINAKERAARVIQCHYRGFIERRKFLKVKASTLFLQIVTRAWFIGRSKIASNKFEIVLFSHRLSFEHQVIFTRYLQFITERYSFLRIQKSVLLIQRATRRWMTQNHMQKAALLSEEKLVNAATTLQSYIRRCMARSRYNITASQIQKVNTVHGGKGKINLELEAATKIQIAWRKFIIRRLFLDQIFAAIVIQRYWRGWLVKRNFLHQKSAILMIQSGFRLHKRQKEFKLYRLSAIEIQRFARGQLARRKLLGASSCQFGQQMDQCKDLVIWSSTELSEMKIFLHSVLILQRWWRRVLWLKSQIRSAVMIQSCIRGWLIREESIRKKRSIVVIQCFWRGYMVRRDAGIKLFDLRNRLLKSKANGDNCMRLIDHLISALSELMGRRVSSILQTCATLDRATSYSQRCCDSLITAGAVKKLLELIQSSNQSPPDREVAKHACSTLRNIACHPDLADVLLSTHGLVETVFQELLRDKDDGYFISCELLKKLCMTRKGIEVVRGSQAFLKRIHAHAEDLKRKANNQRRNPRLFATSATTERRLRAIVDLLELIKDR